MICYPLNLFNSISCASSTADMVNRSVSVYVIVTVHDSSKSNPSLSGVLNSMSWNDIYILATFYRKTFINV